MNKPPEPASLLLRSLADGGRNAETISADQWAVIIDRRLSGAQLEFPYNMTRGEQPEDLLISLSGPEGQKLGGANRETLNAGVCLLAERKVTSTLFTISSSHIELDASNELWIQRFLRLLVVVNPPGIEQYIANWMVVIALPSQRTRHLKSLFLSLLETYLRTANNLHLIAIVAHYVLEDSRTLHEVASVFAKFSPEIFSRELLLPYFSNAIVQLCRSEEEGLPNDLEDLSDTFRIFLDAAAGRNVSVGTISSCLRSLVPIFPKDRNIALTVRDAILEAASLSHFSAFETLQWDDEFWASQQVQAPDQELWARSLREKVVSMFGPNLSKFSGRKICMNLIPFTEHAFMIFYKNVVHYCAGVVIEFKDRGWSAGGMRYALNDQAIQIAIFNSLLAESFPEGELTRLPQPLFTYKDYDLWVSSSRLRNLLRNGAAGQGHELAEKLLSGEDAGSDVSKAELADLLRGAHLVAPTDSDLLDKAKQYCSKLGLNDGIDIYFSDSNVRTCLSLFLDEKADVLCAGGNDSVFLTQSFRQRVKRITTIPYSVKEYFFYTRAFYELGDNRDLLQLLWELWD